MLRSHERDARDLRGSDGRYRENLPTKNTISRESAEQAQGRRAPDLGIWKRATEKDTDETFHKPRAQGHERARSTGFNREIQIKDTERF